MGQLRILERPETRVGGQVARLQFTPDLVSADIVDYAVRLVPASRSSERKWAI